MWIFTLVLMFVAGISFHMSFLHLFSFYEVQHHPTIKRAKNPYRTSKISGVVFFWASSVIILTSHMEIGTNANTYCLIAGFIFWGLFMGFFAGKRFQKDTEKE